MKPTGGAHLAMGPCADPFPTLQRPSLWASLKLTCFLLLGQSLHLLPDIVQRPQPFPVPLVSSPDSNPKDPGEELLG